MKKLLSLLGTMTIIGSSIPTVVAVSSYNERINLGL
ncbi:lipoprotein [Spiroplasma endosymbiont of Glossina fuscipes fuscipes]